MVLVLANDSVMMIASSFRRKGRKEVARASIVKMRVSKATRKVHQLEIGIALLGQAQPNPITSKYGWRLMGHSKLEGNATSMKSANKITVSPIKQWNPGGKFSLFT